MEYFKFIASFNTIIRSKGYTHTHIYIMIVLLRRVSCHEISFTTNISSDSILVSCCCCCCCCRCLLTSLLLHKAHTRTHTHTYMYGINLCLEHHDGYMSRTRCHASPQSCHLARKTESLGCQNSHFNAINLNRKIYENCVCFYRSPRCCCC